MLVRDLNNLQLNWAVAKCEGRLGSDRVYISNSCIIAEGKIPDGVLYVPESAFDIDVSCLKYTTDGRIGMDIIEREGIHIRPCYDNGVRRTGNDAWRANLDFLDGELTLGEFNEYGHTALEAAMKLYVYVKLGHNIEIPKELMKPEVYKLAGLVYN